LLDSHTHLESPRFDEDREQVIARAREVGVTRMVTCGSDLETSAQCVALAAAHGGVHAAVGVHAHEASSAMGGRGVGAVSEEAMTRLALLAEDPRVVAIGEIGLDYHYDFSPRDIQRAVLQRQLRLARDLELPVILHNREADEDLRQTLDAAGSSWRGVLHCFMSDAELATWALERGLYIGIAGPITFRNVAHLPDIVRRVPLDRLLVETDCPWLAPHPRRGRRNEPAYVRYVAERLAEILDVPAEEIAAQTTANACRLFGID
jgi:TatD DNase family protein